MHVTGRNVALAMKHSSLDTVAELYLRPLGAYNSQVLSIVLRPASQLSHCKFYLVSHRHRNSATVSSLDCFFSTLIYRRASQPLDEQDKKASEFLKRARFEKQRSRNLARFSFGR